MAMFKRLLMFTTLLALAVAAAAQAQDASPSAAKTAIFAGGCSGACKSPSMTRLAF
jgi:hypothetical protein